MMVAVSEQAKANAKQSWRDYKANNREKIREQEKARRAADPWLQARMARANARSAAVRYRIDGGTLTKEDFARLRLLPCAYCGVMPAMSVDHVIPLRWGGANAIENLAPACPPCNQRKYAKLPEEFLPPDVLRLLLSGHIPPVWTRE